MTPPDLAFLFLGALAALFVWLIFRERRTRAKQEARRAEERQQRDITKCRAIEEDLRACLMMLRLPALEEQTRLEEATHQLRIVLVERLVSGPMVRWNPSTFRSVE